MPEQPRNPSESDRDRRPATPPNESDAARVNRALSEANVEADRRQADELPTEGGRYLVDGIMVDANGKPISGNKD